MDVEIKEIVEELIDIEHKIGWWIRELEQKELDGVHLPEKNILQNKNILALYRESKLKHALLTRKITEKVEDLKDKVTSEDIFNIEDNLVKALVQTIQKYAIEYYEDLGFIDKNANNRNRQRKTQIGMNYGTDKEDIVNTELAAICSAVGFDGMRCASSKSKKFLKYDKICIIDKAAKRTFYKDYFQNFFKRNIEGTEKNMENPMLTTEQRILNEQKRQTLIRTKYINYFLYFEDRFHGFIREQDYDKFALAEDAIKTGILSPLLNLSEDEINFNIDKIYKRMESELNESLKEMSKKVVQEERNRELNDYEDYENER